MTSSADILVRDPSASNYPFVKPGKRPTQWWIFSAEELSHYGLMVRVRWHYAYIDTLTGEWDAADAVSAMERRHAWFLRDVKKVILDEAAQKTWDSFPERYRGWLKISGFIPFRNIIAIDELGDDVFKDVHLYVPFHPTNGPFDGTGFWERLTTTSRFDGNFEPLLEQAHREV